MEWFGTLEYLSFQEAIDLGLKAPCSAVPALWDIPEKGRVPAEAAQDMAFAIDTCNTCPVRVACRGIPRSDRITGIVGGEIRWHSEEDIFHIRRLTNALEPLLGRRLVDGVA